MGSGEQSRKGPAITAIAGSALWDNRAFTPGVPTPDAVDYAKRQAREHFRRRRAIEPRIRYFKSDYRLSHNFLRRAQGNAIYLLITDTTATLRL